MKVAGGKRNKEKHFFGNQAISSDLLQRVLQEFVQYLQVQKGTRQIQASG